MDAYDKFVICIHKTPDEFAASLQSLVTKAIQAYETRPSQLRHGIALDKFVTVIMSQTEGSRPLCGIYFNLNSPYQKTPVQGSAKRREAKPISGAADI